MPDLGMPDHEDAVPVSAGMEAGLPPVSRRSVLRGAAGAGAAGIAAATFIGSALPAAASTRAAAGPAGEAAAPAGGAEPVVVQVRDAAAGVLEVFRGTTCTRVRDRELAARLVRASG
jgi:hypothetical protein